MPSIDQNIKAWNEKYEWSDQGDEWSRPWGGPAAQWFGSILPRLRSFVPAHRMLEIAPGFGRWTQFLVQLCDELVVVDLSAKCIEACRRRFESISRIEYHVNDGRSLAMVRDDSIDFIFSFDSLVHADLDVLTAYIEQIATRLTQEGVAFIHHSNLGEYIDSSTGRIPEAMGRAGARDSSVSAALVRGVCDRLPLTCLSQELFPWGGEELIDCVTVIARRGSRWGDRTVTLRNTDFAAEIRTVRRIAQLYDWGPFARGEGESPATG